MMWRPKNAQRTIWIVSLFFYSQYLVHNISCANGGHEIFASLSELETLWHGEFEFTNIIQKFKKQFGHPLGALLRYIRSHHVNQLNQTPTVEHLGHPINAYHFIRHVVAGRRMILTDILNKHWLKNNTGQLVWSNSWIYYDALLDLMVNEKMADENDLNGAARGIVKLWSTYRIDLNMLVNHGKVVANLSNGQSATSKSSVMKLDLFDIFTMAGQALQHKHLDAAVVFYQTLLSLIEKDKDEAHHLYFTKFYISYKRANLLLERAKKLHDSVLASKGQFGVLHRCASEPYGPVNQNTNRTKPSPHRRQSILDRDMVYHFKGKSRKKRSLLGRANWAGDYEVGEEELLELQRTTVLQQDMLCRGEQIKHKGQRSHLRCYLKSSVSDWLRLGPMQAQQNGYDPYHIVVKNLLFTNECDSITKMVESKFTGWTATKIHQPMKKGDAWTNVRVMKNVEPQEEENIVFQKLSRRLEHLTGLKANTSSGEAENMLCGDYGIGGDYWAHMDNKGTKISGERAMTVVTILQSPIAGGATIWPYAGISVLPEKGSGIIWYNIFRNSDEDLMSIHKACPVMVGNKVIGNKWIGYNAQWSTAKCGMNEQSLF